MDANDLKNRFRYHAATTQKRRDDHAAVRDSCLNLALWLNAKLPEGREKSLAVTHLEEVMLWANAALARQPEVDDDVGGF